MKAPTKTQKKISKVMDEFKSGKLHSGSKKGPSVNNRKQAIAIALSESRKVGSKYADGGIVDIAAPPKGMMGTSDTSNTPPSPPTVPQFSTPSINSQNYSQAPVSATDASPYPSPTSYGMGAQMNATLQNSVKFAKGGEVSTFRGCGKASRGLTKGKMY